MNRFQDYAAAIRYLDRFIPAPGQGFAPDHALARAQALLAQLDNPQNALPVIHLAGTSGKGSSAAILAAILQAHGLRVGLGTSPHVRYLRERISIDGAAIDEATFCAGLSDLVPAVEAIAADHWGPPSFFEIIVALSYYLFAQTPVDVVVMETGLGGRHDATNTVTRADKLAVLTPIGLDHTEFLGNTVAAIAAAKCGIIHPGNQVLSAAQVPDAAAVIQAACHAAQAPLTVFDPATQLQHVRLDLESVTFDLDLGDDYILPTLHLPLTGAHQAANAGLALLAAHTYLTRHGQRLIPQAVAQGLAQIVLPGRLECHTWHGRPILLDGAHNPQKMDALCTTLETLYPGQRFTVVVALKRDKAADAILQRLYPITERLICTRFTKHDQGMPLSATAPDALAATAATLGFPHIHTADTPANALALALAYPLNTPLIVTGSIYLLPEIYTALDALPPASVAPGVARPAPGY